MTARKPRKSKGFSFGGNWTESKLKVLAGYLSSYTTALQGKPTPEHPFRKAYIDAFAGSGYRTLSNDESSGSAEHLLFPELAENSSQGLLDGSARLALKTQPRFDRYLFIEKDSHRCQELEKLKEEFPDLANDISIHLGEANEQIQKLCMNDWRSHRAVLFLDPFGMQVEWKTIEAIAKTKAIDLWILFPLGIAVNRLLVKSGQIPAAWKNRLDLLFGTSDWYDSFYRMDTRPTLFGDSENRIVKEDMDAIGCYFNNRLKTIFPGVVEKPGVLRNSSNNPLYLLCFAAANERGAPIALKIANHLLREIQ